MNQIIEARSPGESWKKVSGVFETQAGLSQFMNLYRAVHPGAEFRITSAKLRKKVPQAPLMRSR